MGTLGVIRVVGHLAGAGPRMTDENLWQLVNLMVQHLLRSPARVSSCILDGCLRLRNQAHGARFARTTTIWLLEVKRMVMAFRFSIWRKYVVLF